MSDSCSVQDCDRAVTARQMCRMHYLQAWRSGEHTTQPLRTAPAKTCPADHAHEDGTCWEDHGCRCDACVHERKMERQRRRNRLRAYGRDHLIRRPRVPAEPVREHVAKLHELGFGIERIGAAAAVGSGPMMDLWYGPRGAKRGSVSRPRMIGAGYAERLLALDADSIEAAYMPAVGTERRLRALVAIGYTETQLAARLGMNTGNFWTLIHGHRTRVTRKTHDDAVKAFTDLWQHPASSPFSDNARRIAKHYGWVGPLAWDDIDDPHEQPEGIGRQRRASSDEFLDDVEFLLSLGESPHQVASITGSTLGAIAKRADRDGRRILAAKFETATTRASAA